MIENIQRGLAQHQKLFGLRGRPGVLHPIPLERVNEARSGAPSDSVCRTIRKGKQNTNWNQGRENVLHTFRKPFTSYLFTLLIHGQTLQKLSPIQARRVSGIKQGCGLSLFLERKENNMRELLQPNKPRKIGPLSTGAKSSTG